MRYTKQYEDQLCVRPYADENSPLLKNKSQIDHWTLLMINQL